MLTEPPPCLPAPTPSPTELPTSSPAETKSHTSTATLSPPGPSHLSPLTNSYAPSNIQLRSHLLRDALRQVGTALRQDQKISDFTEILQPVPRHVLRPGTEVHRCEMPWTDGGGLAQQGQSLPLWVGTHSGTRYPNSHLCACMPALPHCPPPPFRPPVPAGYSSSHQQDAWGSVEVCKSVNQRERANAC